MCHSSWTTGEIRSLIQEKRTAEKSSVPKGLANMTLDEAEKKMTEFGPGHPAEADERVTGTNDPRLYQVRRGGSRLLREEKELHVQGSAGRVPTLGGARSGSEFQCINGPPQACELRQREVQPGGRRPREECGREVHPSEVDSWSDGYSSRWTTVSAPAGSQAPHPPKARGGNPKKTHARTDDYETKPMNQDVPQRCWRSSRTCPPRCG